MDTTADPQAHADDHEVLRVAVIAGSTRPTRRSLSIARWVVEDASRPDLDLRVLDLAEIDLPLLCEPVAAAFGEYEQDRTKEWSRTVASYDAFVLVCPEYNASFPAVLKNALDHLYAEWKDKAVAYVGYGMSGGIRAVEQLRLVTAELQMAGVTPSLELSPHQVVEGRFQSTPAEDEARAGMLAELARWGRAMRSLRQTENGSAA